MIIESEQLWLQWLKVGREHLRRCLVGGVDKKYILWRVEWLESFPEKFLVC